MLIDLQQSHRVLLLLFSYLFRLVENTMNIVTDKSKGTDKEDEELEDVGLEETTGASDPIGNPHHEEEKGVTVPAGDMEHAPENNSANIIEARSDRKHPLMRWWLRILLILIVITVVIVVPTVLVGKDDDDGEEPTIVYGMIVDINDPEGGEIYPGRVVLDDKGRIAQIERDWDEKYVYSQYILPGFVDSHVHIESSLLVPSEFARLAVLHGTVATVSDPHEIANVLGLEGVRFMLENAGQVPFHFFFGAPSCVPATPFETAGAEITVADIIELFQDDRITMLSEMMNYPGVLGDDELVLTKIAAAKDANRPVDGHAPGLKGNLAAAYISHGISTDHECFTLGEAQDKLSFEMKVQIREGSAARNFEDLYPIIGEDPTNVMFCTDDAHPDFLARQEIDYHVKRSVYLGFDLYDVLRIASKNPIEHYNLPVGLLREGDSADFIVVDNLYDFNVLETWIKGVKVAEDGVSLIDSVPIITMNNFGATEIDTADIARDYTGLVRVILAHDGDLITSEEEHLITDKDVLKLVVVNRYEDAPPAVAYVKGFHLETGAISSSVAHDSHNIVAVGVSDEDIVNAVNAVIAHQGGLAVSGNGTTEVLPLPVAGLMSDGDAFAVAELYSRIDQRAKEYGSLFRAPFMTLSFMALLVIPNLKLSDMGLFDSSTFQFVAVPVPVD
jgi:adenine deaminase